MSISRAFWRVWSAAALLLSGALLSGCPKYGEPEPVAKYGPPPAAAPQPGAADAAAGQAQPNPADSTAESGAAAHGGTDWGSGH
jgi:hypothetical protein